MSTGSDATSSDPVETTVTSPTGGETITISESPAGTSPDPSFEFLGQEVTITSTTTYSALDPATVEFEIEATELPGGGVAAVVVFVDGVPVGEPCTGGDGLTALDPDPCVASRFTDAEGDGHIVVKTTTFSVWNFGVSVGPTCNGLPATRVARGVIFGTSHDDVIVGLGGSNIIYGLSGDDTICAGGGGDIVFGGSGNDTIFGEGGKDFLFGESGRDHLDGGPSRDSCNGGPGFDTATNCEIQGLIP